MSRSRRIKVGITMGDPAGIGPEIVSKALRSLSLRGLAEFVVIGDSSFIKQPLDCRLIDLHNISATSCKPGRVSASSGAASIQYIGKAAQLLKRGELDCLVTCPISKEAIALSGFKFPGHTEYLASLAGVKDFAMMLMNKYFKISLATCHIPLKDVSRRLSSDGIYNIIALTHKSMKGLFGVRRPRILVCGLNPHASDNGLFGKEEGAVIAPAVKKASRFLAGINGPLPCDSVFASALKGSCDAVIAMYHDQALTALKVTDFDSGVNITLGLPYVRTSVLHGTAFDIAGKDIANPSSLIEAVKVAVKCAAN